MIDWLTTLIEDNEFFSGGMILMLLGGTAAYFRKVPELIWNWFLKQVSVEIQVHNTNSVFWMLIEWMEKQGFNKKVRRLKIDNLNTLSPAPGVHLLFHQKKFIKLTRVLQEESIANTIPENITLRFFPCRDKQFARRFLDEIQTQSSNDGRMEVYVNEVYHRVDKRHSSSIVLAEDNDVVSDVRWFIDNQHWYKERGLDHNRGYLLHGPPGNGKTSLVKYIASEFELPLSVIYLKGLTSDIHLLNLITTSQPSVVLIEDLDCHRLSMERVHDNKQNDNLSERITTSGLLNAIDGIIQSVGRMLFITTNHIDKIDQALLRPGRVDKLVKINNATPGQAQKLHQKFFPQAPIKQAEEFASYAADGARSIASLQEELIKMSKI